MLRRCSCLPTGGSGHLRPPAKRGTGTTELVDLLRLVRKPEIQHASPDHAGERKELVAPMGLAESIAGEV